MKTAKELYELREEIFSNHLKKYGWDSMAKMCKQDCMNAMEEFSSLQNRSLVEENDQLKYALRIVRLESSAGKPDNKYIYATANSALSYKEETKNG